ESFAPDGHRAVFRQVQVASKAVVLVADVALERSLIIVDTNEFSVDKNWLSHEFQSSRRVEPASRISTEQEQIEAALAQTKGKVSGAHGAAARLGMPSSTLESRIRSLRINKFQFKG